MTEAQVDPSLMRLFYQLKLYMQTVMFEHFQTALKDYMNFLLSFMLREPDMSEAKVIEEIRHNPWVDLEVRGHFNTYSDKRGVIVNNVDLIPRRNKPMIKVAALIEDASPAKKAFKR